MWPAAVDAAIADRIRILGQLRREDFLPSSMSERIKAVEDRWMLASAGIGVDSTIAADLDRWFAEARGAGYYHISVGDTDECAGSPGALPRKVVRDRRAASTSRIGSNAWIVESASDTHRTVVLNETLW